MRFLGLEVEAIAARDAAGLVESRVRSEVAGSVVIHANLNTAHTATQDPGLLHAMQASGCIVLFEGIGLKVARWLTSGEWHPDSNGTDLVPSVLGRLADRPLRLALVGGLDGVADRAAVLVEQKFLNVRVVGTWNGYSDRRDEGVLLSAINASRPDVLLLGLGTPVQEKLAVAWAARSGAKVTWAVGGLLDYWAGSRKRAPLFLRMLRLEWLWRIALYPRTYGRRYFVQGPWLIRQVARLWLTRGIVPKGTQVQRQKEKLRGPAGGASD